MPQPAVQLINVTKQFGQVVAVDNISLDIEDGEFFSLLGPSGCGKTTTLRMIAGLEVTTMGQILIHGKPMHQTPSFKRPVNTVFQNYALFPHMTIEKNVAFGLEMRGVPKEEIGAQVREALEMVQLPQMAKRRPRQLSGGQQQRIALARALVNRPEVLLLDEPLGALDLKLRKAMQLELKALQSQVGITFVYVTHDQEEALTMSDRIAVMDQGLILQVGAPREIYERPSCRFVADFIGETNFMDGRVTGVDGSNVTVEVDGEVAILATSETPVSVGQEVTVAIRPEKFVLGGVGRVRGRIREVIYIGTDWRYIIQLTSRSEVVARQQNLDPVHSASLRPGEEIGLSWEPYQAMVLTE
nr:ABC transporter ATP-binding protein [Anaerolineae bacterium]